MRKEDGAFIGEVNLHKSVEQDWHEMGIVLDAKYRGMGYSVEALKLLVKHGFEKMQVSAIHNIFEVECKAAIQTHLSAGVQVHSKRDGMIELLITKKGDEK